VNGVHHTISAWDKTNYVYKTFQDVTHFYTTVVSLIRFQV